jgi:hypothetical protein
MTQNVGPGVSHRILAGWATEARALLPSKPEALDETVLSIFPGTCRRLRSTSGFTQQASYTNGHNNTRLDRIGPMTIMSMMYRSNSCVQEVTMLDWQREEQSWSQKRRHV